jgi:hypothetical protein
MGGPTWSGKGPHIAVRIRPMDYVPGSARDRCGGGIVRHCLYCHRCRSTDHSGTVWIPPDDPRVLPSLGHSMNEQSARVKKLALGKEHP